MTPGVDVFLDELTHQRRASPHTVAAYRRDLARLTDFAGATPLAELQSHQLRGFAMKVHGEGLSPRSIARLLSAWRAYYRWLSRRGGLERDPCDGLKAPKRGRVLPKALSVAQTQALLDAPAAEEGDPDLLARDRAMFELLYSSGLRLSELASLDLNSIDRQEGMLTVTGKRAKTRTVPVGRQALEALIDWLGRRTALAGEEERALFVGRNGTRLTPRSIERRLAAWARRQGLGMHVHPHMLRHSFASHVLQSSQDLRGVQELLGHANIRSTQVYTHLDFQHLARVYDAAHPRAKK